MIKFRLLLCMLMLFVLGCSAESETAAQPVTQSETATEPVPTNTAIPPTALPTEPNTPAPTNTATATDVVADDEFAAIVEPTSSPTEVPAAPSPITYGRTADGGYFHGAEDAPLTVIDYSDFV